MEAQEASLPTLQEEGVVVAATVLVVTATGAAVEAKVTSAQ